MMMYSDFKRRLSSLNELNTCTVNLKLWSQNQLNYEKTSVPYELQLMPYFPEFIPHKCLIFHKNESEKDS